MLEYVKGMFNYFIAKVKVATLNMQLNYSVNSLLYLQYSQTINSHIEVM